MKGVAVCERIAKCWSQGALSYIGSHLVDSLVERGVALRVTDNLSSGKLDYIRAHLESGRIEFHQFDLKDPGLAERMMQDIEIVFHLAVDHELLADLERRIRMGERGYAKTIKHFTWKKITDEVERSYLDLIAETPRSRSRQWSLGSLPAVHSGRASWQAARPDRSWGRR